MFTVAAHTVPPLAEDIRLYDYAAMVFSDYIPSRKGIKKALKRGAIFVDDRVGNSGDWVREGQQIELRDLELSPPKPYPLPLEIVYEDDYVAVINKPAGITVSGNQYRTVQNAIVGQLKASSQPDALQWPRPVHRLDNPTSGVLMIAKTARALMHLGAQFANRSVAKTYHAIVMGTPPDSMDIHTPMEGQTAHTTLVRVQQVPSLRSDVLSLVQLHPHTGRTHQLRIHCAGQGFPILGDTLYGPKGNTLLHKGLFLCATSLRCTHPHSGQTVTFQIELPAKFTTQLSKEARRWEKFRG